MIQKNMDEAPAATAVAALFITLLSITGMSVIAFLLFDMLQAGTGFVLFLLVSVGFLILAYVGRHDDWWIVFTALAFASVVTCVVWFGRDAEVVFRGLLG